MATKSKAIEFSFKNLREAVVALNDSGLIETKIKLVGDTKETILKNFMDAVGKIPDKEGKFPGPKVVLDFYNERVDAEEKAAKGGSENKEGEKGGEGTAAGTTPAKTKGAGSGAATGKENKENEAPRVTKKSCVIAGVTKVGGSSVDQMAEACTAAGLGDLETNKKTVVLWLKKLGFKVKKLDNGNWIKDEPAKTDAPAADEGAKVDAPAEGTDK